MYDASIATPATIVGCGSDEITYLERYYRVVLPDEYRRLLLQMGKTAGLLFADCDWLYPEIVHLTNLMKHAATQCNNSHLLPPSGFCMLSREQSQFLFFECNGRPDIVYRYSADEESVEEYASSVISLVIGEVEEFERTGIGASAIDNIIRLHHSAELRANAVRHLSFPPPENWEPPNTESG